MRETKAPEMDEYQGAALARIAQGESFLIQGGPGSGKTTVLREALVTLLGDASQKESDWSPVMVLTPDRRRAVEFERLAGAGLLGKVNSPGGHRLIRSVNSYAYLVVSQWLVERDDSLPRPKLAGGADEDLWFTGWLAGQREEWGQHLPEAVLDSASFRMELRNLIARVGEAGISPEELRELGRLGANPLWRLAADAYGAYVGDDSLAFSPYSPRIDAARIQIIAAKLLQRWELDAAQHGVNAAAPIPACVLIDDLQDCTFATAPLIAALIQGGSTVVATSSPDTASAVFRGGQADLDSWVAERQGLPIHKLAGQFRITGAALRVFQAVRQWIDPRESPDPLEDSGQPLVMPVIVSGEGRRGSYLANVLREQHFLGGIPWNRQAVIVRAASDIEPLRRQLQRKDVPLAPTQRALRFSQIPVCAALLRILVPDVDVNEAALQLLQSPLINVDMLQLYQLLRQAHTESTEADTGIVELLESPELLEAAKGQRGLTTVVGQLQQAARVWAMRDTAMKQTPQVGLWSLWSQLDRADAWRETALSGGWEGDRADERLDAVIALFRKADLWEQQKLAEAPASLPTAASFAQALVDETVESDSIAETGLRNPGVEIVTIAQAAGREWDVVCVTGLQDGRWPTVARPGGILDLPRLQRLVEVLRQTAWGPGQALAGFLADPDLFAPLDGRSFQMEARRDEARLLAAAVSRARGFLDLVAIEDNDQAVSPFLNYLARQGAIESFRTEGGGVVSPLQTEELDLPHLVGHLRYSTTDGDAEVERRHESAVLLAVMAEEGIDAADPRTWTGAGGISSADPIVEPSRLRLNPSHLQAARDCLLQWFLSAIHGGDQRGAFTAASPDSAMIGTIIHDLAENHPHASAEQLQELVNARWEELGLDDGTWWARRLKDSVDDMMVLLGTYQQGDRGRVDTEVPFQIPLGESTVTGRIDRVEYRADGSAHIVDIKTGKNAPTKEQVAHNLQLATYQLALIRGGQEVSGASLLTIAAPAAQRNPVRTQEPLSEEAADQLEGDMTEMAGRMLGPDYVPTPGDHCRFCHFTSVCPAKDLGMRGIE